LQGLERDRPERERAVRESFHWFADDDERALAQISDRGHEATVRAGRQFPLGNRDLDRAVPKRKQKAFQDDAHELIAPQCGQMPPFNEVELGDVPLAVHLKPGPERRKQQPLHRDRRVSEECSIRRRPDDLIPVITLQRVPERRQVGRQRGWGGAPIVR
jgi:hypothetical protein